MGGRGGRSALLEAPTPRMATHGAQHPRPPTQQPPPDATASADNIQDRPPRRCRTSRHDPFQTLSSALNHRRQTLPARNGSHPTARTARRPRPGAGADTQAWACSFCQSCFPLASKTVPGGSRRPPPERGLRDAACAGRGRSRRLRLRIPQRRRPCPSWRRRRVTLHTSGSAAGPLVPGAEARTGPEGSRGGRCGLASVRGAGCRGCRAFAARFPTHRSWR